MERKNVLVIGLRPEEYRERACVLARASFEVDRFPSASHAIDLVSRIPFAVLILRYPLPDMALEEFLGQVRAPRSPCRTSALVLIANRADRDQAESYVGRGANRVVLLEDQATQLHAAVAELLDVAPRKSGRVMAVLNVAALDGPEWLYCQSVNLSLSGMLIEAERRFTPGTAIDFQLRLPDDPVPCSGRGQVARIATTDQGGVRGFALRFESFRDDGAERYARLLDKLCSVELMRHEP